MRKKIAALILCGIMSISLLAGCNKDTQGDQKTGDKTQTTETKKNDGKKIKVRVTRWGSLDEQKAETKLVEEYNASNDKNIEIVYDIVPGDGYGDRLTTSFSSGDGYDVFLSGEGDFYKWVDKGLTLPLDDLIANDKEFVNSFPDSIYNMGKINGEMNYLIGGENPILLYYNKDMFDAKGLDYPSNDWTWDDLFVAAEKLTTKNEDGTYETYGFNAQNWAYSVLTYLESQGLNFMNEDGTLAEGYMNSKETAEALDRYFNMADGENKVSPAAADLDTFGSATAMMVSGKLGMFVSGGWDIKPLQDANCNYGTALIPGDHTSYICASGFAIGANCKNPEAAWEVLKLFTNERASQLRTELEGALPTAKTDLDALLKTYDEKDKAFIQTLDYGVQPIGMRSELGSKINEITNEMFERIIFKDGTTQDILDEYVKKVSE